MTSRNTNHDSHHFKAGDNISTGDARNHCAAALVTTVTTDTSRVLKPNVRANRSLRTTDVTGDVVTLVTKPRKISGARGRGGYRSPDEGTLDRIRSKARKKPD